MAVYAVPAYIFSIAEVNSTVAANNIIATWNPPGSGLIFVPDTLTVSYKAISGGDSDPLRGYRISQQPTGGTLAYNPQSPNNSVLCKLDTAFPNSAAYIYTGNPSVGTLGAPFFTTPESIERETSADRVIFGDVKNADLLIRPGEGLVIRQNTGKVGDYWNLTLTWGSRAE